LTKDAQNYEIKGNKPNYSVTELKQSNGDNLNNKNVKPAGISKLKRRNV
jgi:hypothetical protein